MARPSGMARGIEVFTRRDGQVLRLVSRYRPRGLLVALGLTMIIASTAMTLLDRGIDSFRLECSRTTDWCTLSDGQRTVERFPLSRTLRFEVRRAGRHWELAAVTQDESVDLFWGSAADLGARAAELNGFLRDLSEERWTFEYDPQAGFRRTMLRVLPLLMILSLLVVFLAASDKVTIFDPIHRLASRRFPFLPSTRRLDGVRAVAVRAMGDERRRGTTGSTPYSRGSPWRRIVLLEQDGSSWWVTPWQHRRYAPTDLDAVAAELASYLGLPLDSPSGESGKMNDA